jgi:hypothetical protein
MSDLSARLSLPYLAPAQAQKHVTVNEALRRLDAIVQLTVVSATTAVQPASPADGQIWLLPLGKSGAAWGAMSTDALAYWRDGAWEQVAPKEGWLAYVQDSDQLLAFNGSSWGGPSLQNLALLGVNAAADATNKLAVSSPAVLFNHAGAGVQTKLNKNAAGDTASFLFQTGFSGRAEFGLIGNDDFTLKVSADGASWANALTVNRTTGAVTFPQLSTFSAGITVRAGIQQTNSSGLMSGGVSGANFFLYSNGVYYLDSYEGGGFIFRGKAYAELMAFTASAVRGGADNTQSLGTGGNRWSVVYAATGAINTSDAREKTPLAPIPAGVKRAVRRVLAGVGVFQWLEPIDRKGQDGARLHVGATAQAVRYAFFAKGEDPTRLAIFCEDPVFEAVEAATEDAPPVLAPRPVLDADGSPRVRLGVRHDQLAMLALAVLAEGS